MSSLRERAIATLHSVESTDDDVLQYLLRDVLVHNLRVNATAVDPAVLTLLVDSPTSLTGKKSGQLRECRAAFAAALEQDSLLLLPLHSQGHWSLLCYRPAWRQWYCCDSMGALHLNRAKACMEALDRHLLVPVDEQTRSYFYDDMPRQPQSYECARYVLFYAFVLLRTFMDEKSHDDAVKFADALERELPLVCEANRPAFEGHLLRILGCNK